MSHPGDDDTILGNIQFTVTSVNDAPVLADLAPAISLDEDVSDGANTGSTIATLIGNSAVTETDDRVDPGTASDDTPIKAIAITGTTLTGGTLEFSIDGGSNFTNVDAVTTDAANALLLDASDKVRFVPNTDFHGSGGSFTFRAWDQSSTAAGSHGTRVSTTANGGTTEFSSFQEPATITVDSVNDAPPATFLDSSNVLRVSPLVIKPSTESKMKQ